MTTVEILPITYSKIRLFGVLVLILLIADISLGWFERDLETISLLYVSSLMLLILGLFGFKYKATISKEKVTQQTYCFNIRFLNKTHEINLFNKVDTITLFGSKYVYLEGNKKIYICSSYFGLDCELIKSEISQLLEF